MPTNSQLFDIFQASSLNKIHIDAITGFDNASQIDDLDLDIDDDELIRITKIWEESTSNNTFNLEKVSKRNFRYYIGDFTTYDFRDYYQTIDNRIFTSLETIIPIVTAKPAQPVVYANNTTKESKELAEQHQKLLLSIYKELNIQQIEEILVRHGQLYRIGVVKYGLKNGRIYSDYVLPTRLIFDPNCTSHDDSEFIGERLSVSAKDLIASFPDKEDDILAECSGKILTKLDCIEWWTPNFMCLIMKGKVVLNKTKNPFFDYTGAKKEKNSVFGEYISKDYRYNYFESPKIPYIFFKVYNSGLGFLDDTTALEQCIPLQDTINRLMYQINNNAEIVGNPILLVQGMDKKQIEDLGQRKEGAAIGISSEQSISYLQPGALPSYLMNQIQVCKSEIDDIFGTHATTRGDREAQETMGGRQLLRQGDEDRQATIGRAIERLLQELYRAWTHIIKVFYTKEQLVQDLTSTGASEYLKMSRNNIEDGMEIYVLAGSTLPDDKISKRTEALQLWGQRAITIEKLYEKLGWDNPESEGKMYRLDQVKTQLIDEQLKQIAQAYFEGGKPFDIDGISEALVHGDKSAKKEEEKGAKEIQALSGLAGEKETEEVEETNEGENTEQPKEEVKNEETITEQPQIEENAQMTEETIPK